MKRRSSLPTLEGQIREKLLFRRHDMPSPPRWDGSPSSRAANNNLPEPRQDGPRCTPDFPHDPLTLSRPPRLFSPPKGALNRQGLAGVVDYDVESCVELNAAVVLSLLSISP